MIDNLILATTVVLITILYLTGSMLFKSKSNSGLVEVNRLTESVDSKSETIQLRFQEEINLKSKKTKLEKKVSFLRNTPYSNGLKLNENQSQSEENAVESYFKRKLELFLVDQNGLTYSHSDRIMDSNKLYLERIEQNNTLRETLGHADVDKLNEEVLLQHEEELRSILGDLLYMEFLKWRQDQEKIIADSLAGDREPLSSLN